MKAFLLFATATLTIATASDAAAAANDGFMPFWAKFRAAVLRGDMEAIAAATRFPLKAGFDDDQDHTKPVSRAQFPAYFRTELKCESNDSGTNLEAIRRRVKLDPKYDYDNGTLSTVGIFAFERTGGQWKLATINYGATGEYYSRLKGRCS